MNVGKAIQSFLKEKNMKQNDMAKILGISAVRMSVIANSKRVSLKSIELISEALKIKPSELIRRAEKID